MYVYKPVYNFVVIKIGGSCESRLTARQEEMVVPREEPRADFMEAHYQLYSLTASISSYC